MKIGYSPISDDYSHPEDRKRVCFYLKEKKLAFEKASLGRDYELVFLSTLADIEGWRSYKAKSNETHRNCKMVFNLSDSYLAANRYDLRNVFRGAYRYITGRTSRLRFSYQRSLVDMLGVADAVTCASVEGKRHLDQFNSNVHIIHDYCGGDVRQRKSTLDMEDGVINILWQGLSHGNEKIFVLLRDILAGVMGVKVNVHIITDQTYCKFGAKHLCKPTSSLLHEIFRGTDVKVFFYSWHSITFSAIAASCDMALIPIPKEDPIMWGKPESKLIELWSIGIPVLTSATPAYKRVMQEAQVDWSCDGIAEWRSKISALIQSQQARQDYMRSTRQLVDNRYSKQELLRRWDMLIESLW